MPTLAERIMQRADRTGSCWLWTGSLNRYDYAEMKVNGRKHMAHRVAYEQFVSPVPEGLQLDHLCRVRHCVNPAHLEPVTQAENLRRGVSPTAINGRKTHCDHGHEFTAENTYVKGSGSRECRACAAARQRRRYRVANGLPEETTPPVPNAFKTRCPQGHPYDEANTMVRACGRRRCRTCHSAKSKTRRRSTKGGTANV